MSTVSKTYCDNCGEECGSITAGGEVHVSVWVNHGHVCKEDWVFCKKCLPTPWFVSQYDWYDKIKFAVLSMLRKMLGEDQK